MPGWCWRFRLFSLQIPHSPVRAEPSAGLQEVCFFLRNGCFKCMNQCGYAGLCACKIQWCCIWSLIIVSSLPYPWQQGWHCRIFVDFSNPNCSMILSILDWLSCIKHARLIRIIFQFNSFNILTSHFGISEIKFSTSRSWNGAPESLGKYWWVFQVLLTLSLIMYIAYSNI